MHGAPERAVARRPVLALVRGNSTGPGLSFLLGDRLAGAAQLFREVLELGEAVFHGQHGRLIIDVYRGRERKRWDRRCVDIDQIPLRVPRQQMAAAELAPLAIAPLGLVVLADLLFSLGDLDRLGLPQRECVDRARRPAPAVGAVAVARAQRIARDLDRDSTAEALPCEGRFLLAHVLLLTFEVQGTNCGWPAHATELQRTAGGYRPAAVPDLQQPRHRPRPPVKGPAGS